MVRSWCAAVVGLGCGVRGHGKRVSGMTMASRSRVAWLVVFIAATFLPSCSGVSDREADGPTEGRGDGVVARATEQHPRLMVRRGDLPRLRKRAETAAGKALLKQIRERIGEDHKHTARDDAVAHGFLYALTGEVRHAEAARKVVEAWIQQPAAGPQTGGRAAVAVMAWDLIHDSCDAEFNRRMVDAIEVNYARLRDIGGVRPNRSMASNFNARWRPALGLMALAVLNEPDANQIRAKEMLEFARGHVAGYLTRALGDGGWNAEGDHYTNWSLRSAMAFVHAWRNCMGEPLIEGQNLGNYLPVCTMRTVFRENGAFVPSLGVGMSGLYFHRGILAMGYPLVAKKYRPGVLWHWNRIRELSNRKVGRLCSMSPGSAVWEFLHYPVDGQAENPAEAFAKVWTDREKGVYFFRSEWTEAELAGQERLTVFHAKHPPTVGGWSGANAGVFRIYGLGYPWVVRGPGGKVGHWSTDNVVMTDDVPAAMGGGTRVVSPTTEFERARDGSGLVTVNMEGLYGRPATRCMAVDYSGRSGAEGLYVLRDQIEGDGEKTWQIWVAGDVRIEGNTFTVSREGTEASLRGTFLRPAEVELTKTSTKGLKVINPTDNSGRKTNNRVIGMHLWPNRWRKISYVIRATSKAEEFLAVMTLQDGNAPEIKTQGSGEGMRVQIGKQTVELTQDGISLDGMNE
jgi:hypothetical protein